MINIPQWIDQDITPNDIAAILQGGCESGAYMPAVTYHTARETMNEHGDDVLDYLEEFYVPELPKGISWSGIACHFLSAAVECWCAEHEHLSDWENHEPVRELS